MSQENVEVVRRAYDAYLRNDLDAAYACLHPEIEFHTYSESPEAGVYQGREAVRRYNESLFEQFESFRVEIEEVVAAGDRVVVVSTQYAVPKGGQQEIDVHMTEVWTIRDALLAERHSYSTRAEALRAAGLEE
jgi:ketosteroid isomerase-like protein